MKSPIFYFLLIALFPVNSIFANGGPIDWSNVLNCGDIKLVNNEKIKVVKEHLKIKIIGDYSHVNVIYTLDNQSDDADVSYGFPTDIIQSPYDSYFEFRSGDLPEISFKLNN